MNVKLDLPVQKGPNHVYAGCSLEIVHVVDEKSPNYLRIFWLSMSTNGFDPIHTFRNQLQKNQLRDQWKYAAPLRSKNYVVWISRILVLKNTVADADEDHSQTQTFPGPIPLWAQIRPDLEKVWYRYTDYTSDIVSIPLIAARYQGCGQCSGAVQ